MATSKNEYDKLSRRNFIKKSSSAVLSSIALTSILNNNALAFSEMTSQLNCQNISEHFFEKGNFVNWANTTDTFKAGDPTKPIKKVAVAWKASWEAMRHAVSQGADLFISHESICVNAKNGSPEQEITFALPSEMPKFEWLEKSGLVVYRCHDFWDEYPESGVRTTWQKRLNIGNNIIADDYPLLVTEIEPTTVESLSKHVLNLVKPLKQNGVMVSGELNRKISKVATGTGVTVDPVKMKELGADVGIMTDDYFTHVRMGIHAAELDFPMIFVNHGVAEEWAIQNLAKYIQNIFPSIEVIHIPQYCPFTVIV